MKTIQFELSMPNVGSWNGVWTGAQKKYYLFAKLPNIKASKVIPTGDIDSWHYDFEDGWGARVTASFVDAKTRKANEKMSAGFRGYGWMVTEILAYGRILDRSDRILLKKNGKYLCDLV